MAERLSISRRHPWIGSPPSQGQAPGPWHLGVLIVRVDGRRVPGSFTQGGPKYSTKDVFSSSITLTATMVPSKIGTSFSSSITLTPTFATFIFLRIYEGSGSLTGGFQVLGGL